MAATTEKLPLFAGALSTRGGLGWWILQQHLQCGRARKQPRHVVFCNFRSKQLYSANSYLESSSIFEKKKKVFI